MIQSFLFVLMSCFVSYDNSRSTIELEDSGCALPAPKNLHWEAAGTTYLQMAWDPVPGAAFYRIYFYNFANGEYITDRLVVALPKDNFAMVDRLPPGGSFSVVVKAVCANGIESSKEQ